MTKICEICGGGGADKTGFGTGLSVLWYHSNTADCRRHLLTRAETAEAELANYKQWHEQEQIRAVDAEHQWGELVGELIPALGLPDEECGDNAGEVILAAVAALQARAKAAEEKLSTIRYCARYDREVNKDAVDGKTLPQWISLLYLAYIGDYMNPDVLGQIERGSLFFPNAPIYAERDAAVARATAAENRLAELAAAARWRPVSERPGRAGYYKTACIDLPSETDRVYYSRVGGWDYDIDFWQPLPAGGNGQKENEMIDEQEAEQRRLVEIIAELLNDEANTITDRSEKRALIARIAALREFNRWRPVSETPVDDKPVLALMESGEYKVARYVVIADINGVPLHHWRGTGGTSKHVAYWRPIVVPVTKEEKQHD